jgi:2-polyprenyl-6-hydroxyphenyl methylase / 3-demethylubiquinone-9 3-methyltransferase
MDQSDDNIDALEIAKFTAQADRWWELTGEFKALHEINPVRLAYVQAQAAGLKGQQVLDVGCGGGLLAEAMAARGARVTGIDRVAAALAAAATHAGAKGLRINYRHATAEAWAQGHAGQYDIVTCMELVEHVPDPARLVRACAQLVRPGGHLFFATVNRTWQARLLVIWVSEYVLGIVRKGTHAHARFVRPDELSRWGRQTGLVLAHLTGLRYLPFIGYVRLCKSTAMNYLMHFVRPVAP